MPKRVLITAGSTREAIDEVMTIDNMSTGSLGIRLAERFLAAGHTVTLAGNLRLPETRLFARLDGARGFSFVPITSCEELLSALSRIAAEAGADLIIHAAAVGDYKTEYTFLLEDMAAHIGREIAARGLTGADEIAAAVLALMADPAFKIRNDSKISSNQPNLTVKLGLTPKIIARLRALFPAAFIVGFKLLENVPKEELYAYAQNICLKNDVNGVMANDLAELRAGKATRYLVDKNGYTGCALETPDALFAAVAGLAKL